MIFRFKIIIFYFLLFLFVFCQAVLTMVPEAWQNDKNMPEDKRDFYQWAAFAMEPWDGPGKAFHSLFSFLLCCRQVFFFFLIFPFMVLLVLHC
jgi:hypothetical protein